MFRDIFKKTKTDVITIKVYNEYLPNWGGNGLIFYVRNGKGILSNKYGYLENDALQTLVYGDTPLIKFQGDGPYFCPTCEKLVSAGYGLDMSDEKVISEMREIFNQKFVSIEESFENLKSLLGLLPTGYYGLVDTELCPTNGNGEFFWKLSNKPTYNKASCPIYGGDGLWSTGIPYYILPTQPTSHYDVNQAEFYKKSQGYRAIAYHLDGYLCALIDGHHKAVASAMNKEKVKALVIIPASSIWETNKKNNIKGGISFNKVNLYEDEMITSVADVMDSWKSKQLTKEETERYLSLINENFNSCEWSKDILDVEEYFPDVSTVARIEWAGDISDSRLDKIIKNKEPLSDEDALNISSALYYSKNPRFKEVSFYFCRNYSFVSVWYKIYELISQIKDEEVENFFIEYLVNDDRNHPDVKKIVDNYFAQ